MLKKPLNEHFQNEVSKTKQRYFESESTTVTNGNHHNNNLRNGQETNGHADDDAVNGNGVHANGHHMIGSVTNGNILRARLAEERELEKAIQDETLKAKAKLLQDIRLDVADDGLAWTRDGKIYRDGPDQILPSRAMRVWDAKGAVKIRPMGTGRMENTQPISVPSFLKKCADRAPNRLALRVKRNGEWQRWTYKEYLNDVRTAAKGFIALGLEPYHAVCILGFNSPEWFISDLGAIFAGGFAAGIYTTNAPDACAYCAEDSKANIYVVEDEKQLAKVLEVRDKLPHLKAIIQYTGEPTAPGVLSWAKLMTLGNQQSDDVLEERLKRIAINQCCTLIYTSGTTGNPKGVMLSHDNLTWMAHVNEEWAGFREVTDTHQEEVVSFLPLSHVAAQMADMYCPLSVCGAVAFADKNALKGTLVDNLQEVRPTKFLAVPRVWEKIHEKITEVGRSTTGIKRVIANWAKAKGLETNLKKMNGVPDAESLGFKVANKVVFSKIQEKLGLDRCDLNLSGAAPISPDVLRFFMSLNIVVTEAYGMSECSGPHCMATGSAYRIGSVGKTMVGCKTKISNPDKDGNGEILMGGRHVCMGYLNQEDKTRAALDDEGFMHSEDIGRLDADGFLFITGRLKEILITAGGENVAPVPIEDTIKGELPLVSQAVVIGDKLRFLSTLLTLKTEVDVNTQEPLDKLTPMCKDWIEKNSGCTVNTLPDVLNELYKKKNKQLIQAIQSGIDRTNARATSQAQKIQKWVILPMDFSIPGGELGPTLKLKRSVVYEKYSETIADMYKFGQRE